MSELHLHTTITPMGPAGAIILTDEQVTALGGTKTPPVIVTIAGRTERLRVGRMGGKNLLGFSKAARVALGIDLGDDVDAVITLDTGERTVDVPEALASALDADPALRSAFDALSYTNRKEMARSISDAKQEATRERRLEKALEALRG